MLIFASNSVVNLTDRAGSRINDKVMKQYIVSFNKPVAHKCTSEKYNKITRQWEKEDKIEMVETITFFNLTDAKNFIKEHIDFYKTSSIIKMWSNGDFENCGEINISGNNAKRLSNMTQYNY